MPIAAADILIKGSTGDTAGPGNSIANGGAGTNLGEFASAGTLASATLHNIFPAVTGDENAASNVDYQCIFVHNNHATLTYQAVKVWVSAENTAGADADIGVDPTAASAVGAAAAQAVLVANKNTAPAGVAFSNPTTKATGLNIGDLAPGQVRAVWIRRSAANTVAVDSDSVTVTFEGDSAA